MATALETNILEAQTRKPGTKNEARRVRRDGKIPAVVYGAGKDSLSISVDPRVVTRILNSETGHNSIFDLALNGEKTKAMIVDWQYEPIKGRLLHIDLKRIALDKVLRVSVPIFLTGEAGNRLLRNVGKKFEDVTKDAGITTPGVVSLSARWLDLDQDWRRTFEDARDWLPLTVTPVGAAPSAGTTRGFVAVLSGALLDPRSMRELLPGFEKEAPIDEVGAFLLYFILLLIYYDILE